MKIPYYNISSIKAFALEGWTLGKTHGLPHWQRVERNGILLSLKEYNGSLYRILRKPIEANSLHIEFDYCYVKPLDAFYINTEDDSYLCYPKKDNVVTKLSFAVEELYQLHLKRVK